MTLTIARIFELRTSDFGPRLLDDTSTSTVTDLLQQVRSGDSSASDRLFLLVYETLKRRAHRQREQWYGDNTLNTTAIVHETYLKLFDQQKAEWESQVHFLSVASKAMRHILIDHARKRQAGKRGGGAARVSLDEIHVRAEDVLTITEDKADSLVALDEALITLAKIEPREAAVVECRFFGGMTIAETAAALGISPMTVKRDWAMAQAWLLKEMKNAE